MNWELSVFVFVLFSAFDCNYCSVPSNDSLPTSYQKEDQNIGKPPEWSEADRMKKTLYAEPAGNTVKFRCAVKGNPTPIMNWFKDGRIIKKDSRIGDFKYKSSGRMIVLESVVPADEGEYMCSATNKYGSINHTYYLDVQERAASRPLLMNGLPENKTVYVGADVEFRCIVFSDPHPHVKWVRHYENISNITVLKESGINVTEAESLKLHKVTEADSGQYTCFAENYIGETSNSAWLMVKKVPTTTPCVTSSTTENNLPVYLIGAVLALVVIIALSLLLYYCCYNKNVTPEPDYVRACIEDGNEMRRLEDENRALKKALSIGMTQTYRDAGNIDRLLELE